MSLIEDRLNTALVEIRRALLASPAGVGPNDVRVLLRRINLGLGLPPETGLTPTSYSRKEGLPMRCEGGAPDPDGGCWFCAAGPHKQGPRCPRRSA